MKKIAVLNGGSKTRKAFSNGSPSVDIDFLRSKDMLLHIQDDLSLTYIHRNSPYLFAIEYFFTRLRGHDQHFCGIIFEHIESLDIPMNDVINLKFPYAEEKISQMPRLARANIVVPETIIFQEDSYMSNKEYLSTHLFFPCVFKTDGSQGKNVSLINSLEELETLLSNKPKHRLCLIQRVIPNTFDTRTIVFKDTILGTIKRTAATGSFHNNVAMGASVAPYTLTEEETHIAIKACRVNGIDFGGVDLIHTPTGPVVLEVNKSPQIHGFESIYGKDFVFGTIAKHIEKLLK